MAKQLYWKPRHEALVMEWSSGDSRQQFRIYDELKPAIEKMIEIISNRYYAIPYSRQDEYQADCLQFVFLSLMKYEPKRQTSYAFMGYLIKNWYYDRLVRIGGNERLDVTSIEEHHPEAEPMTWDCNELDKDTLIKILRTRIKDLNQEIENQSNHYITNKGRYIEIQRERKNISITNRLIILNLLIEFIGKYDSFINKDVQDYLVYNTDLTLTSVTYYVNKMFGVHVKTGYKLNGDKDKRVSDKYHDVINDDFCPNEDRWQRRDQKHKMSKRK